MARLVVLENMSNFIPWHRQFRQGALHHGIWTLLSGEETVTATEPDLEEYLAAVQSDIQQENIKPAAKSVGPPRYIDVATQTVDLLATIKAGPDNVVKQPPTKDDQCQQVPGHFEPSRKSTAQESNAPKSDSQELIENPAENPAENPTQNTEKIASEQPIQKPARDPADKPAQGATPQKSTTEEPAAPETSNAEKFVSMAAELATFRFERDHAKWKRDKIKLRSIYRNLHVSVQPAVLRSISLTEDGPIAGYQRILELFKGPSHQNIVALLREFGLLKFDNFSRGHIHNCSAIDYIQNSRDIQMDLKLYGYNLSDEDICRQLLFGLPKSFGTFRANYKAAMQAQGTPDGHDLDILSRKLIEESEERHRRYCPHRDRGQNRRSRRGR